MNKAQLVGLSLAVLAAFFNGMVGIFSVNLFKTGLTPTAVAFSKCALAFLFIIVVLACTKRIGSFIRYLRLKWKGLIICSFFGFFMLYFFETAAYETLEVAVVVFLLFGVSTLVTFFANAVVERRNLYKNEWLSFSAAVLGLYLLFMDDSDLSNGSYFGYVCAVLAGVGYGLFLTFNKKLDIGGGLIPVCGLLLFGLAYLFIPFAISGGFYIDKDAWIALILLALLPTIGGFWCTTKALTILKSQAVMLAELSEPIFALTLGFIFLGQLVTPMQMAGGAVIIGAILIHEIKFPLQYVPRKSE